MMDSSILDESREPLKLPAFEKGSHAVCHSRAGGVAG